ncbi:hypothetical protein NQ318_005061 [Aromia moschata]|uniref:Coil containing protein n=1 Tax=Aromia moschata TaxID=1265417 RepID=A0AAV8YH05_9CUCU|nr:hypothetical protein NQ318_005061 [Aromia moschata]
MTRPTEKSVWFWDGDLTFSYVFCAAESEFVIKNRGSAEIPKLVPTNELAEDDFDRRILFCEQMMQMIDDNILQIENVLFSDESTFTLHGHVNRQNGHYWSSENPHWMRELYTQNPEKVNVWAGIIRENITGPFFIDGNLNGESNLVAAVTYEVCLLNNRTDAAISALRACRDKFEQNCVW